MLGRSVGIDVRMWDHPGIGRYIRELAKRVARDLPPGQVVFLGYEKNRSELTASLGPKTPNQFRVLRSRVYSIGEQFELERQSRDLKLLHVPHFNIPILRKKATISTVHDLTYLREPSAARPLARAYARFMFRRLCKKSAAILTVSEFTKKDLLAFEPRLKEDRVSVTPEAASPAFRVLPDRAEVASFLNAKSIRTPFFLYVGSLKPHKNLPVLIEAAARLKGRKLPHTLVIVGRADKTSSKILETIQQSAFVQYLGELTDEELVRVYNGADLFVLPSLREGFGLPVVEAMACGTPVCCSNRGSLPEIIGGAGRLFDPTSVDAMAGVLYNVLMDSMLRKSLSTQGLQQAKLFTWERTAQKTLAVYQSVLG